MEAQEGLASHGKRRIGSFQMKRNAESALSQHAAGWRDLLKTKDFGWLWAGQVVSQLGDGLTKVALLWFVYSLTGSALKMTLIGVLQTIPPLAFGAFAGVLIDRVPKRAAMITIDLVRAALLVLIPLLYAMGLLSLPWLYVLVFVGSLFAMAFGPALNASVPLLVKRNQLVRANAIMQSSMTIGQLLGPAISGILIAVIGAQNVLYVNAAAFVLSALCKLPIHIPHPRSSGKRFSAREALRVTERGVSFCLYSRALPAVAYGQRVVVYHGGDRLYLYAARIWRAGSAHDIGPARVAMVRAEPRHFCHDHLAGVQKGRRFLSKIVDHRRRSCRGRGGRVRADRGEVFCIGCRNYRGYWGQFRPRYPDRFRIASAIDAAGPAGPGF